MSDINSHHLLPRTAATMLQVTADRWSTIYGTRHALLSSLNTFMQMPAARYDNSQAAKPDTPHLLILKPVAFEAASIIDSTRPPPSYGKLTFGTEPIGTGALLPRAPRLNGKAPKAQLGILNEMPARVRAATGVELLVPPNPYG